MKVPDFTAFAADWRTDPGWALVVQGLAAATAVVGFGPQVWGGWAMAYWGSGDLNLALGGILALLVVPIYAGWFQTWRRDRTRVCLPPVVTIAGMPVAADDLKTSLLVTGVTGSAKTAGILLPVLAQLLTIYKEEDGESTADIAHQKLGAFIPEVKGDLVDAAIYLAHEAGRCVCRDFIIVTPNCRIPVVRFRDEQGRAWYLAGRGGAGGSDAADMLGAGLNGAGAPGHVRAPSYGALEDPAESVAAMGEWSRRTIAVGALRPRFVGWRWEGAGLRRVSHTLRADGAEPVLGLDGRPVWVSAPCSLTPEAVLHLDNGVHYNLVDARLPAAEVAERLTRLAAMARGSGARGENEYFYEQGRKLLGACISLHRAVNPTPCTMTDIVRLATQDAPLDAALANLVTKVRAFQALADAAELAQADEIRRRQVAPLQELEAYFRDEWLKMVADGKTANVIKSTLSATFGIFLQDPNLAETFGQASSFSFEEIVQSGKLIGLVPGDRYEQLGRLLGTACKLDFQSTMLSRSSRPELNSRRLALYFADECHKYVIGGSATAGDPYFMNLSRSNQVVNICATQSYAWLMEVLGREAANVYISAFGVQFWLQQTDPETCRRAAEICGTITREKISAEHNFNLGGLLAALGSGREMIIRQHRRAEEAPRHPAEAFAQLDVGDIVAYNKGRPGRLAKVRKGRAQFHFCTQRPEGVAAVHARVREYYREILENLAHARGDCACWDCEPPVAEPVGALSPPSIAEAPPTPAPHTPAVGAVYGLSAHQIQREREEFMAYLGTWDAAIGSLTGDDPMEMALADAEAGDCGSFAAHQARRQQARDESVARESVRESQDSPAQPPDRAWEEAPNPLSRP